ncbi:PTS sugar transporter subunit IIC [Acidaminobacter sp. JC074]|uniref:PTS sugar transporter subunit IIC n=1 Tax=Acidaminobacter sp. JC074 TaxID=2530199 RepID=UPI001F0EFCD6|nr:PTS sugar transporter subunit IIC [Acidaminobacter sp. JC074]MCH4887244.1 PTS sugar transporter subunit IIC [Acidaminobacter sp. JC074]
MKGLLQWFEEYFVPFAAKVGSQKHLVAIRDGFIAIMPLIIAGSFAVLINVFPVDAWTKFLDTTVGGYIRSTNGNIWTGSFMIMSYLVAFTIPYSFAKNKGSNELATGLLGLATFIILMPGMEEGWGLPNAWAGTNSLFVSIFNGLFVAELFTRLFGNDKLVIKLPDGVPPAVAKSFAALLPSLITIVAVSVIKVIWVEAFEISNIMEFVMNTIQKPLIGMANTLPAAITVAFFNHFLWFFGLHGSNILEPLMQSLYLPALEANAAGTGQFIVTKPFFDAFVYMGGSGTTIALLAAIFVASKRRKDLRDIAKLGIAPGIFNINEPVIFGLPIVLSPVFFIPFIIAPVVLTIIAFTATAIGFVPLTTVMVPWTTPPVLGGYLATGGSFTGGALALFNLAVAFIIYLPFVLIAEKLDGVEV